MEKLLIFCIYSIYFGKKLINNEISKKIIGILKCNCDFPVPDSIKVIFPFNIVSVKKKRKLMDFF